MTIEIFNTLEEVASKLRSDDKKTQLLFAHNGVGKTRLSGLFKALGKDGGKSDTLYFNAFTEDLFHWDNDLENDTTRVLQLKESKFFKVLEGEGFDIQTRIRNFLNRYADFNFNIETVIKKVEIAGRKVDKIIKQVSFSREVVAGDATKTTENIKISRGEENIFIWSFFLAIVELAIDDDEAYKWVKYIYIDDPISSLDDNNAITVASHLAQILKDSKDKKFIISTHHGLFYNVIFNELSRAEKYLLTNDNNKYKLETLTSDTPFYQHIGILKELNKVAQSGKIYTYHFNLLRNILEKTAAFHGFNKFSECIKVENDDIDKIIQIRQINLLSHGNYSIFEPQEMQDENKEHFKNILENFITAYRFNDELL
jgi:wobble nucleotide-excising tRNase